MLGILICFNFDLINVFHSNNNNNNDHNNKSFNYKSIYFMFQK